MGDFQVCPDDHKCEHGSLCVENPTAEGKYYCDCDEANDPNNIYSGLYCEHHATVYCTLSGEMSRTTFCTNEGTCKAIVDDDEAHMGCDCPPGYDGEHCQFIEGSKPEGWPVNTPTVTTPNWSGASSSSNGAISDSSSGGVSGGAVFGIVVGIILLFLVGYIIRRRIRLSQTHVTDHNKSTDGHLHDAEGQTVPVRPTTTPTFDSDMYMTETPNHYDTDSADLDSSGGPQMT